MKKKNYENLELKELDELLLKLTKDRQKLIIDIDKKMQKLSELYDRRDNLDYTKKRAQDIINNKKLKKEKRRGFTLAGISVLTLGTSAYLGLSISEQSNYLLSLITSGTISIGTGMGSYITYLNYKYDQKLITNSSLANIDIKEKELNKKIDNLLENIKSNKRTLNEYDKNIYLLGNKRFELSNYKKITYPIIKENKPKTKTLTK